VALTQSYLITTKNLPAFLAAIQSAKAPERFTTKFLNQLEFTSSNDRLYLGVLKGLGFIDEAGVPTKRYYAFLDQSESGKVLAEAIRGAYEDLFAVNKKAQDLSLDDVKNKLKALTQGQKSDNVTNLMAGLRRWPRRPTGRRPRQHRQSLRRSAQAHQQVQPAWQVLLPPAPHLLHTHSQVASTRSSSFGTTSTSTCRSRGIQLSSTRSSRQCASTCLLSRMETDLYSFTFRALLTEEALDKTPRISRLALTSNVDADVAKRLPIEALDEDLVARARHSRTR
jgi:hypothetical protein